MTSNPTGRLLDWPHRGLTTVRNADSQWEVVKPPRRAPRLARRPDFSRPAGPRSFAVVGDRVQALRALSGTGRAAFELAYVDVPRTRSFAVAGDHALAAWLTLVDSVLTATRPLLAGAGVVAVHADDRDAPWVAAILEDVFGCGAHRATFAWQKKYAPQNDLTGRVDDAHDFIYVYGNGDGPGAVECWSHSFAGKTEDATREVERLRDEKVVRLPEVPKTGKPELLVRRLLERFTRPGGLVLEAFSDTGFGAAAAIACGRVPLLLVGATPGERALFEGCAKPRMEHALRQAAGGRKPRLETLRLEAGGHASPLKAPDAATVSLAGTGGMDPSGGDIRPVLVEGVLDGPAFSLLSISGASTEEIRSCLPVLGNKASLAWVDFAALELGTRDRVARLERYLLAAMRLVTRDGYLALACAEGDLALVRLLAERAFGREQHAGTVVLASAPSPGFVVLFRPLPQEDSRMGFVASRDYVDDGDPRGPWRDPGNKGARSGGKGLAYPVRVPPYRWSLESGRLPPGCFRVSPETGVIWAPRLDKAGVYQFKVRVTDAEGASSVAACTLEVVRDGAPPPGTGVWFLDRSPARTDQAPRIVTKRLPRGEVGQAYSAVLEASGGRPFDHVRLPGTATAGGNRTRYWEVSRTTLVKALMEDRVRFGTSGTGNPSRKKYRGEEAANGRQVSVELGWWDAERLGGESPLSRLCRMVTNEGDLVVLVGTDPAPVGLKRRWAHVGRAEPDKPRGTLGPVVARVHREPQRMELFHGRDDFAAGLAWCEGFIPCSNLPPTHAVEAERIPGCMLAGVSPDGTTACVWLDPKAWPTAGVIRAIEEHVASRYEKVVLYYFRGWVPRAPAGMLFRRVPFDLVSRGWNA